ncbi:MAG: hypothetical protein HW412_112 [Bacteroidetes bacterium]|nr:hypothetical protein [Bacteroidota bacterium]
MNGGGVMAKHYVWITMGLLCLGALIGSCKKDEGQPTSTPPGPLLNANVPGVIVSSGTSQNVTITGGTYPYTAQSANPGLATASFVNANVDTAILVITGVSTATGGTSVVVRDASTPQKSVSIGVTKQ